MQVSDLCLRVHESLLTFVWPSQCERRGLDCTYPLENRRGVRTPKDNGDDFIKKFGVIKDKTSGFGVKPQAVQLVDAMDFAELTEFSDDSSSEWDGDN